VSSLHFALARLCNASLQKCKTFGAKNSIILYKLKNILYNLYNIMNIELNSIMVLAVLIVMIIYYLCTTQKKEKREKWTLLAGAPQKWSKLPRESAICDTGFYDDECKFSAVNCINNQNSAFYDNA
jgi:hypothetical protein